MYDTKCMILLQQELQAKQVSLNYVKFIGRFCTTATTFWSMKVCVVDIDEGQNDPTKTGSEGY